jgi:hypothetical protein
MMPGSQDAYNTAEGDYHDTCCLFTCGSLFNLDPQILQTYEQYSDYQSQQYAIYMPMAEHPGVSSPSAGPSPGNDDSENQPFVITPEYEAIANAEFEEAVRSGAMHGSMTPAVTSPVVMSSGMQRGARDYFQSDPAGSVNVLSSSLQQQTAPLSTQAQHSGVGYAPYHPQHRPQPRHEVFYSNPQAADDDVSISPPSDSMHYYKPESPPRGDPSHPNRWYR